MIAAAWRGCLMPGGSWAAPLAGVHPGVLSVRHPDGALVSLVGDVARAEARALVLDPGDLSGLLRWARRAKPAPALSYAEGESATLGPFSIDLSACRTWDPRPALARAAEELRRAEWRRPGAAGEVQAALAGLLQRRLPPESVFRAGAFRDAFRSRLEDADDCPWSLAGFGPGTTPAGDDFLAGCLLARRLWPGAGGGAPRVPPACFPRTTAAGQALLRAADQGAFPAHLAALGPALAAACADGDYGGLEAAAERFFAHGATSGTDALAGFLFGAGGKSAIDLLML